MSNLSMTINVEAPALVAAVEKLAAAMTVDPNILTPDAPRPQMPAPAAVPPQMPAPATGPAPAMPQTPGPAPAPVTPPPAPAAPGPSGHHRQFPLVREDGQNFVALPGVHRPQDDAPHHCPLPLHRRSPM